MDNVRTVMNQYTNFKTDRKFLKRLLVLKREFINKDIESISFFGGNLLGVYPVKWVNEDMEKWLGLIGVDDLEGLRTAIYDLPNIDSKFQISSNPVNLSYLYVASMALTSNDITNKDKDALASAAIDMLQYKFISSIHTHYFKYTANEGIALATYESLDRKSGLKRYGSWQGLLDAKTETILDIDNTMLVRIIDLTDDEATVRMMNDIQGSIKSIMNSLTDRFYEILNADTKFTSSDRFTTIEGEQIVKDSVNKYESIRLNLHTTVLDRNSFISAELIDVVLKTITTTNYANVNDTLVYISENYESRKIGKELNILNERIIIFLFTYLRSEGIALDNIPLIALKLRALFRSSRATDSDLLSIRNDMGDVVRDALDTKSKGVMASTRLAVILYIVLRALLRN